MWKKGHVKSECPALLKKNKIYSKKDKTSKKTYVAWDGNEVSSSSNVNHINKALMTS